MKQLVAMKLHIDTLCYINSWNISSIRLLTQAVLRNDIGIVKLLLEKETDPNRKSEP